MTRARLRLQYITNDTVRKATFKKRKGGFFKKITELTTLCGVEACAIIYSPFDPRPEVWPSNPVGVQRVISRYNMMPDLLPTPRKKIFNQVTFTEERIAKAKEQLKRLRRDNREKVTDLIMVECIGGMGLENLSMLDLNDTAWLVEKKIAEINRKMQEMDREQAENDQVYRPELPPAPSDGEINADQRWNANMNSRNYLAFGGDDEMLQLPFGDITQKEYDIWSQMFPSMF